MLLRPRPRLLVRCGVGCPRRRHRQHAVLVRFLIVSSRVIKLASLNDEEILEKLWLTWGHSQPEDRACPLPSAAAVAALPREWPSHLRHRTLQQ